MINTKFNFIGLNKEANDYLSFLPDIYNATRNVCFIESFGKNSLIIREVNSDNIKEIV